MTHAQPRAMSRKTGDQYAVPLCHDHHMRLHESPMPERSWWAAHGVKPIVWAENMYQRWMRNYGD